MRKPFRRAEDAGILVGVLAGACFLHGLAGPTRTASISVGEGNLPATFVLRNTVFVPVFLLLLAPVIAQRSLRDIIRVLYVALLVSLAVPHPRAFSPSTMPVDATATTAIAPGAIWAPYVSGGSPWDDLAAWLMPFLALWLFLDFATVVIRSSEWSYDRSPHVPRGACLWTSLLTMLFGVIPVAILYPMSWAAVAYGGFPLASRREYWVSLAFFFTAFPLKAWFTNAVYDRIKVRYLGAVP